MKKISIMNYKGGTGKTTTVINLAAGLALKGKKVLIIDTDSQGSASYHLGFESPPYTLYDLLVGNVPLEKCILPARQNIDIICANERLFPAEMQLSRLPNREKILSSKLQNLQGYDFVLLDCAPSLNLMNQNVLFYANSIYLPVSMEYLSLVGIKQLLSNMTIINQILKHYVTISKVIPTFFDKRQTKSKNVLESLNRVFPNQVVTPIRVSQTLSNASGNQKTVFELDTESIGASDYMNLTEEVLNNG